MTPPVERPYERHVFVCTYGPWCAQAGAVPVQKRLKALVKELGLKDLRVNQSGCLNQCGHGPMAVVYPEGVWYHHLDVAKAERVASEHLAGMRVVEEYRYYAESPGANKTPEVKAKEAAEKASKGPKA